MPGYLVWRELLVAVGRERLVEAGAVSVRLVGFGQVSRTNSLSHLAPELVGVVQGLGLAVTLGQVLLAEAEVGADSAVFGVLDLPQTDCACRRGGRSARWRRRCTRVGYHR